ncbi:MAG: hypothetical protein NC229_08925 [Bacteroides sp.]|nr:hypothetical protein [Bacteroidales bacterium]MCM1068702.1 hypothetical protein [Prevotella sp.]MCM1354766.1 hypothetical protein [Bacteroides sp.]MCM1443681.1 hypothetical protein [Muribaculum sp.]MCM1403880.1 hypothetical protein [Bacteroides sp.]
MTTTENIVLTAIYDLTSKRKAAKRMPANITLHELRLYTAEYLTEGELRKALNKLYREGRIAVGDTLNDKWIMIND